MKRIYLFTYCLISFLSFSTKILGSIGIDTSKVISSSQYGFIENKGQVHDQYFNDRDDIIFYGITSNFYFHISKTGISYQLVKPKRSIPVTESYIAGFDSISEKAVVDYEVTRVDVKWLDVNNEAVILKEKPSNELLNFYNTTETNGVLNVRTFDGFFIKNIYDNIDLHYYFVNGKLKYDYIVRPGGDPNDIRFEVSGTDHLEVSKDGSLQMHTPLGTIEEEVPISFQNQNEIITNWKVEGNNFGFEISNYYTDRELIIDPLTRVWGTYYGHLDAESGRTSCNTDQSGNVYFSGTTNSLSQIATTGSFDEILNSTDVYVSKFNSDGVRQWGTYFGGVAIEIINSASIDPSGSIYLSGQTSSSSGISTAGSHQITYGGSIDMFLVKFNSSGLRDWGTYLGGTLGEGNYGNGCITDQLGNVFLVGSTSTTTGLTTAFAHQTVYGGGFIDLLISKFNSLGQLQWSTYYGGTVNDQQGSCAIDNLGNLIVAGYTNSPNAIGTAGTYQPNQIAFDDAFIAKFTTSGTRLWGTYFGGSSAETAQHCATDNVGNIYIVGSTLTKNGLAMPGAFQIAHGGALLVPFTYDGYLAKFSPSGLLKWSTYYGGTEFDLTYSVCAKGVNQVLIAGSSSSNSGIASSLTHQSNFGGGINRDAFLAIFDSSGTRIEATYYGGTGNDSGTGCDVDASGNIYLSGTTFTNTGNIIATTGSHQPTPYISGAGDDAYLVKFGPLVPLPIELLSFDAIKVEDRVLLEWSTATEINNDYFTIEKSNNANQFENIGTIDGAGNSTSFLNYSFYDLFPFAGNNYYRLKQTDFNGAFSYSQIKSVEYNSKSSDDYIIFPNPNEGQFEILFNVPDSEERRIEITDAVGKMCFVKEVKSKVEYINLNNFSKGIYFLSLKEHSNNLVGKTKKIIIH